MASRTFNQKQALEREIKTLFSKITYSPSQAVATLATTVPIVLTKVAKNSLYNGHTYTLQILAAAANPTNTVLAVWTGTASATVLTITPNDGTNNTATPVSLTTAEVAELITSGSVVGKTVTVTDASALRALATATGGGAILVGDGDEGDGLVGTFAGASDFTLDNSFGIYSVALTAVGTLRFYLEDKYNFLRSITHILIDSTARDFTTQVKAYDVNPTSGRAYIDVYLLTAGSATNLPENTKLVTEINLKNTSSVI